MTPDNPDDPITAIERDTEELKRSFDKESSAATEALHDAGTAARQKAAELASEAKAAAYNKAESVQNQASSSLQTFAAAVRSAGDQLAESEQGAAARLVREAANGLEQLSNTLANKRVEEVLDDVRDFGRHHPTAFIAGSVLAGIALGRFIRSTASDNGRTRTGSRQTRGEAYADRSGNVEIGARPGTTSASVPQSNPPSGNYRDTMSGRNP